MNPLDEGFSFLRDEVGDPTIRTLFEEESGEFESAVRELVERASSDDRVADLLIETLESSVDEFIDDTDASSWIAIILGEARVHAAIDVLLRTFAIDDDETLQDAASVALLRIGPTALESLMEWLDEEPGRHLRREGYRLLGESGLVEHEFANDEREESEQLRNVPGGNVPGGNVSGGNVSGGNISGGNISGGNISGGNVLGGHGGFVERVRQFLRERIARERHLDPTESSLEAAISAIARLGDRESLDPLREILRRDFGGMQPVIQDAIEQLEDNPDGVPFIPTRSPWMDRYGWLFDDHSGHAATSRRHLRSEGAHFEDAPQVRIDGVDDDDEL